MGRTSRIARASAEMERLSNHLLDPQPLRRHLRRERRAVRLVGRLYVERAADHGHHVRPAVHGAGASGLGVRGLVDGADRRR